MILRYFEKGIGTTSNVHALIALPYVRTELQLRFTWFLAGLTREECDPDQRIKVFLNDSSKRVDGLRKSDKSVSKAERRSLFYRFYPRTASAYRYQR